MPPYTVEDVLRRLPSPRVPPLPATAYAGPHDDPRKRVGLAVESMKRHMTSEGWDLFAGLEHAGYTLHGHDIGPSMTDVPEILARENPGTVVVQDQREIDGLTADRSRDPRIRFRRMEALRERGDVFRVTVLKDAQHNPLYHRASAATMGVNAWIVYYHPRIVHHLAPYTRPAHLVRTWHTVDRTLVPPYMPEGRKGCVVSGALSGAYPLRQRLVREASSLPDCAVLRHPGYGRSGCHTPAYLRTLSQFRVSICTASVYGYALRKIIEGVACGCVVVTDLPCDEVVPVIDTSLVRVRPDARTAEIADVVRHQIDQYDPERQAFHAGRACDWFDFRYEGRRLAAAVEALRRDYDAGGAA